MTADHKLSVRLSRDEKVDTGSGPTLLRKQHFSLSLEEIEVIKKYFTLLDYFQRYHVYSVDAIQKSSPMSPDNSTTN